MAVGTGIGIVAPLIFRSLFGGGGSQQDQVTPYDYWGVGGEGYNILAGGEDQSFGLEDSGILEAIASLQDRSDLENSGLEQFFNEIIPMLLDNSQGLQEAEQANFDSIGLLNQSGLPGLTAEESAFLDQQFSQFEGTSSTVPARNAFSRQSQIASQLLQGTGSGASDNSIASILTQLLSLEQNSQQFADSLDQDQGQFESQQLSSGIGGILNLIFGDLLPLLMKDNSSSNEPVGGA